MKRFLKIAYILVVVAAIATACHKDEVAVYEPDAPQGYMAISVPVSMPDMKVVETRGVDPDGMNIHKMSLFCFDNFGMFISYVSDVEIQVDANGTSGHVAQALIPEATRRVHFVANQNLSTFNENENLGKSEMDIMPTLESSSGMMIYWGRFAADVSTADEFKQQLQQAHGAADKPLKLLRNQAKVSVAVESGVNFGVAGFAVVNTNAFGTVAPLHPELGFDFTIEQFNSADFVNLPNEPEHQAKLTPPVDVDNAAETYVFETENTADDPVSVIIKGDDGKYYRAMLILDEEYKKIRRNHHYILNIVGPLSFGANSFAEALEAPATNNIWLSIDDEVNEVRNSEYILGVDQTEVVILAVPDGSGYKYYQVGENGKKTEMTQTNGYYSLGLGYSISNIDGTAVSADEKPQVSWVQNDVATDWIENVFVTSATKHRINLRLNGFDTSDNAQKKEGTIQVKKGLLQRNIKIIMLKQQSFIPMWVTTQMYGGDITPESHDEEFVGANVTVMFTVPEVCPDELLPFEVYVSVDHLDVRAESGQPLPVIRSDDPRYGVDVKKHPNAAAGSAEANEIIGYKYVYTVTKKGDQRIYYKNILDQTTHSQHAGHVEQVTVESPYFMTESKDYVFATENHTKAISIANLKTYNALSGTEAVEYVYYMLVPQKKGAMVEVDVQLIDLQNNANTPIHANIYDGTTSDTFDEFLLYTENLWHDANHITSTNCVVDMKDVTSLEDYKTRAKTYAMRFTKDWDDSANEKYYKMIMYTNKAKSAEVVRLASNQTNFLPAAWEVNANSQGLYNGSTYRSRIFELANYRPFRFMAKVNGTGESVDHDATDANVDAPTNVTWEYGPSAEVNVEFDITEFTANDGAKVDPFGLEFKVYIDAPMLEWNTESPNYTKLINANKIGTESDGRFYYVVNADRVAEAAFWSGTTTAHATVANRKAGERKVLPFRAKSIVSTGKIVISADPSLVIYDKKEFNVSNEPIRGQITYAGSNVPANSFVSFALISDNSRIGSMTITSDGNYELRLRSEYNFDWEASGDDDTITVAFQSGDNTYTANIKDLKTLKSNPNIALVLAN